MNNKFKNYGFWLSLVSAVLILLQVVGLKINVPVVSEITNAILGVLVVLGIISNPSQGKGYKDDEFDDIAKPFVQNHNSDFDLSENSEDETE